MNHIIFEAKVEGIVDLSSVVGSSSLRKIADLVQDFVDSFYDEFKKLAGKGKGYIIDFKINSEENWWPKTAEEFKQFSLKKDCIISKCRNRSSNTYKLLRKRINKDFNYRYAVRSAYVGNGRFIYWIGYTSKSIKEKDEQKV